MWTSDQVRELRKRRGQNQADFGRDAGVDRVTVSRWESGAVEVSPLSAAALDRLAAGATAPPPPQVHGLTAADARGIRYAAEVMAATLADVLRTARMLEEPRDPRDIAADQPTPSERQVAPRRQAKGR